MVIDIATRAYNHTFRIDPIIRSLMDTDFYKLLMQQMIVRDHPNLDVKFRLTNRSRVRLAEVIDLGELKEQLDHARKLRFQNSELIWLTGNTFYGQDKMFAPAYIEWLRHF